MPIPNSFNKFDVQMLNKKQQGRSKILNKKRAIPELSSSSRAILKYKKEESYSNQFPRNTNSY